IDAAPDINALGVHLDGFHHAHRTICAQGDVAEEARNLLARRYRPCQRQREKRKETEAKQQAHDAQNLTVGTARSASFSSSKYCAFWNPNGPAMKLEGTDST